MKKQFFSLFKACVCGVMVLAGAASCEKMNVEDADKESKANVVLRIGSVEQVPFEMARTRGRDVNGVCSRLNFLVYQGGERIRQINQTSEDEGFGEAQIQLPEGRFFLVVLRIAVMAIRHRRMRTRSALRIRLGSRIHSSTATV
jgi:hypothetical protein